jgi:hypothetical protein
MAADTNSEIERLSEAANSLTNPSRVHEPRPSKAKAITGKSAGSRTTEPDDGRRYKQ